MFSVRSLRLSLGLALLTVLAACGNSLPGSVDKPVSGGAVRHVFVIVLENKSFARSFGDGAASAYLSKDLPAMGVTLRQYYGTGHASLDNYITMISGQPPNILTQLDCPLFVDVIPGIVDPLVGLGVLIGQGCVYPKSTLTIADQLETAKYDWKGYMQDMGDDVDRDVSATCAHPALNSADGTESAAASDQYATRHNPFMYFHSIIDDQPRCDQHVVNLRELENDLKSEATTPNFAFITPDLCADGHDGSCADSTSPGGYDGIDAFLREWVPKITSSAAFRQDGLLLVTFDESDDNPDDGNDACCDEQTGPNTTAPGAGNAGTNPLFLTYAGGGRIGGVIVSPFTRGGTFSDQPYNHYSMLRSFENLFALDHLGYAGQGGLLPFGEDVYNNGVIPAGAGG